jgi:hypothetical protein
MTGAIRRLRMDANLNCEHAEPHAGTQTDRRGRG